MIYVVYHISQYKRWRPKSEYKQKFQSRVEEIVADEIRKKDVQDASRPTKCGIFIEIILILFSLTIVPILVGLVYYIWPV